MRTELVIDGVKLDKRLFSKQWRVNHLYKVVNKKKKLVTFRLNKIQELLVSTRWFRNIYLKARQLGITTWACVDGLDDVLFKNDFTMVIIAHEKDAVQKIFKKVKTAWDNMDPELVKFMGWQEISNNANELSFSHGSSIRVALSSRSDTVNRLHISEFGKICAKYPLKAIEIITGAFPSVPEDGIIDVESTAEGEFGAFHDMFWEAFKRQKKTGEKEPPAKKMFKAFFFPWTMEKEYALAGDFDDIPRELIDYGKEAGLTKEQINWYFIERQTQKAKMKQEYPTTPEEAFEVSGNKLFDTEIVKAIKVKDPEIVGDWQYFEKYNPRHVYAIGADVAEGVGQDSSTAVIMDFSTEKPTVVATFQSNMIAPDTFGYELEKASKAYGFALIAPERNNHGFTTIVKLRELEANVYKQEESVEEVKGTVGGKPIINKRKLVKYGWHTNGATKPKMFYDFNEAIEEGWVEIQSQLLKDEIRTYDKVDLSQIHFDENQTKHWDLLIAACICWQMKTKVVTQRASEKRVHALNQTSFS